MLAHELARFNIPVRIIDKASQPGRQSRAIAVQIRTLEIFSALGLYNSLVSKAQALGALYIYVEKRPPLVIKPVLTSSAFLKPLFIDQSHTEHVLEQSLNELGVIVERGVELINLKQTPLGITAELQIQNAGIEICGPFSFVVGADGAHSFVRKYMGESFAGSTYDDAFILADATCTDADSAHREQEEEGKFRIFFKKSHFLAMIPMHGKGHYRLISVRKDERSRQGPEPTVQEFQNLIAKLVPFDFKLRNISWVSRFFVQCRSAQHYQKTPFFLIGDAAHIHSPAGGQGMNTGLQDAFNLAFKLALAHKRLAVPTIVETYEAERKPVGDFLIKYTDRFFKFMVRSSLWARLLRRLVLPRFAGSPKCRAEIFRIGSQTAIRYKEGLLCPKRHHELADIKIGLRLINWPLIDNHLHKTDIHSCAITNFFTCFIFVPANYNKKGAQKIYKHVHKIIAKFSFIKLIAIFASDYDAEKIMGEQDYCVLIDSLNSPLFTEFFYVITRTDAHVFCADFITNFDHAEQALQRWYISHD
jgi:2-polyprenyl-6-methoxyphenol hydroxylase-like FAD-dependent oxidoreductase